MSHLLVHPWETMKYENIVVFVDFNSNAIESFCDEFIINFGLSNIVKVATCYKNSENPTTIDLILTNRKHSENPTTINLIFTNQKNSVQNTTALEVGLSDFHKLILTVLKARFFLFFLMQFCPGTMTTHAKSINSDLQRGLERRLRHTQH